MRLELAVSAAIALGSAAALASGAGTAEPPGGGDHVSAALAVVPPPGWSRTAGVSCPADAVQGDCFQVDYFRGPRGQWVRVVIDPPGDPQGYDAVLPVRRDDRGRIDPVRTVPADVAGLRSVAVTASAGGRRYVVLHGAGPDAPLEVEALRAFVWGLDRCG